MKSITSVISRLTQAVGVASENHETRETRRDRLRSRNIIHVAFLLHQKLPADLVPIVLEYAEFWEIIRLDSPHVPARRISEHESPRLHAGAIVPYHIPRGHIRLIRFITVSRDQGWTQYRENRNTYDSYWSWFEAGVVEPDVIDPGNEAELECGHTRYDGDHLRQCLAKPSIYKWGSRRIVTNLHVGKEFREHIIEWRGEDEDTRQMLREIRGGYGIEFSAFARYPGWFNYVRSVDIEIECAVVRKL